MKPATCVELVQALAAGRIDFALTLGLSAEPDLRSETIAHAPARVIVSADHPLVGEGSVELTELSTELLVLLDLPHSGDYFRSLVAAIGTAPDPATAPGATRPCAPWWPGNSATPCSTSGQRPVRPTAWAGAARPW
ncbi:LysR substrate-binding domain-containing protein [Actinomadura miaoliensis]|uniref:LysR substrate-binding domain-containing protein n=1 Tax=Actinomadura miaoliensis TaxID=430685 RepID=UPI003CD0A71F